MQTIFIHEPGWSHTRKLPKTFHTVNWNGILLVYCCFCGFSQFLSGETKVSNKNKGVELTSMKTTSAKNNIPAGPHWSSSNYFLFPCSVSFTEDKELGLQTSLVNCFHNFKKFCFDLLLNVRNYLRKSPIC